MLKLICPVISFSSMFFWFISKFPLWYKSTVLTACTFLDSCSGVERGFKGKPYPRLAKMILSATLTQDPGKLAQLDLHHPLFLTTGKRRYKLPEKLESYMMVNWPHLLINLWSNHFLGVCLWRTEVQLTIKLGHHWALILARGLALVLGFGF